MNGYENSGKFESKKCCFGNFDLKILSYKLTVDEKCFESLLYISLIKLCQIQFHVTHGENTCFSVSAFMKALEMVFQEHIRSLSNESIFVAKKSPWMVNMIVLESIQQ